MTLGRLSKATTIRGNVRLALWRHNEEVTVDRFEYVEDLEQIPGLGLWKAMEIASIHAGTDGFLHIDFDAE